MIEHAGGIVEDEAVDLAYADDHLERMSERVVCENESCYDEAEWSPGKLLSTSSQLFFQNGGAREYAEGCLGTDSCNGFHAQHEWVRSQVSRIR